MTDLSTTIAPKSSQLNADDLIGREMTVKITKVSAGTKEQPIAINFEGDRGKPYFPSKGMRRVMVMIWGKDGNEYAGRSMTLYRDPKVLFGGIAVGGIRISHMSHINEDTTVPVAETQGARKPVRIKVLRQEGGQAAGPAQQQEERRPAAGGAGGGTPRQANKPSGPTLEQMRAGADRMANAIDCCHKYEEFQAVITDPKFIADRKLLPAGLEQTVADAEKNALEFFGQETNVSADDDAAPSDAAQDTQG